MKEDAAERAELYQVAPLHLPRPSWWDHQDKLIEDAEKKGLAPAFGVRNSWTVRPIQSYQNAPNTHE